MQLSQMLKYRHLKIIPNANKLWLIWEKLEVPHRCKKELKLEYPFRIKHEDKITKTKTLVRKDLKHLTTHLEIYLKIKELLHLL